MATATWQNARRALLRKRKTLIHRYEEAIKEENELLANREIDVPDLAADRTAAGVLGKLGDAELLQLQRITGALERMESGTYGFCAVCSKPIPSERLKVMPEADRCATCTNSH